MPQFASNVDYETVYRTAYFGHKDNTTSFPPSLPPALAGLCRTNGLGALFDISGGNGELGRQVGAFGIATAFSDVAEIEGGIRLNLADRHDAAIAAVQGQLRSSFGHVPYLATCLDVLEHMDVEDVPAALRSLHDLTQDLLIVSISTRPSSQHNRFHTAIFPMPMWMELLTEAGFDVVDPNIFPDCSTLRRHDGGVVENTFIIDHWQSLDVFRDVRFGEPRYALLRRRAASGAETERALARLLDLDVLHDKRARFAWTPDLPLCLAINSMQDVHVFAPLLQVLPRRNVYIALRRHVLPKAYERLLQTKWERCGLVVYPYERAEDINLNWMVGGTWVSATESTMWAVHQLGFHAANHARMSGLSTILFQHGIWMESAPGRSIAFASEYVATWGERERQDFERHETTFARRPVARGTYAGVTAVPIGSPKFADACAAIDPHYAYRRFGIDRSKFSRVVLVGLNLHWGVHGQPEHATLSAVRAGIDANPETFFILKMHSAYGVNAPDDWSGVNRIVVDDYILCCLDLTMSRIVKSVDLVMSTLSTLLLDAAVAGTPAVQLDTDAALAYDGVSPVPIADAFRQLDRPLDAGAARDFVARYAAAAHGDFYGDFARFLGERPRREAVESPSRDQVVTLALGSEMERQWLAAVHR